MELTSQLQFFLLLSTSRPKSSFIWLLHSFFQKYLFFASLNVGHAILILHCLSLFKFLSPFLCIHLKQEVRDWRWLNELEQTLLLQRTVIRFPEPVSTSLRVIQQLWTEWVPAHMFTCPHTNTQTYPHIHNQK